MKAQRGGVAKGYFHLCGFGYINSSMKILTYNIIVCAKPFSWLAAKQFVKLHK